MDQPETATTSEARPRTVAAESHRRSADGGGPRPADPLRSLRPLVILAGVALVTTVLYFGRAVLLPLALAGLLAFLLAPVTAALQRVGLGRVMSVAIVMVVLVAFLAGFAWTLATQVTSLGNELPKYRGNIRAKIADIRGVRKDTAIDKLRQEAEAALGEIQKDEPRAGESRTPVPVVVENPSLLWRLPTVLELLASAGLVVVLVIFMLLRRQELRNRIIRLAGYGRLPAATRVLDEAAERVSRYLLTQSMMNGGFGFAVALGLFVIGVPYAFLWGVLLACLRFIPYVGTWIAALLPITLSLAVFEGWQRPLLVVALFVVLEPLIYLVLEPLVYGHSAGVSEVALLAAVAFWTWIWGPVGLIMATPLTVCLVVFAKHVPALEFVTVLMGDEPVLESRVSFYQRLLADDLDEAMELVDGELAARPHEEIYDALLLPALSYARRDRARGRLHDTEERSVALAVRDVLDDLESSEPAAPVRRAPCVVGCPVRDEADVVALAMLKVLTTGRCRVEILSPDLLIGEIIEAVERSEASIVSVAALPPVGLPRARYLCKRLRARFPDLRIVVGRWTVEAEDTEHTRRLLEAGADAVHRTLLETRDYVWSLAARPAPTPAVPASADARPLRPEAA